MQGDAARRFCFTCEKHVHNLSALSEGEARRLLTAAQPGRLCVQYAADADGHVLFRSKIGMAPRRRVPSGAIAAGVASGLLAACAAPIDDEPDAYVSNDGGLASVGEQFGFAGAGAYPAPASEARAAERIVAMPVPDPDRDADVFGKVPIETHPSGGTHAKDTPRHSGSEGLDPEPHFTMGRYMPVPPPRARSRSAVDDEIEGMIQEVIKARAREITVTRGDVAWEPDESAKR